MNINERFPYKKLERTETGNRRLYLTPENEKLPSVTTILGKTKPKEKAQALEEWRNRVGHEEAKKISHEAATVGTLMHSYLESWVETENIQLDKDDAPRTKYEMIAKRMARVVIKNISPYLDEIWGSEVSLYNPGLYAGTADLPAVWKGRPTICDFKQTNRPKKKEWIEDYFLQGCLYAEAHNELYGTNIESVAIFMCSRDCQFQLFEVTGDEYHRYLLNAIERLKSYYKITDL